MLQALSALKFNEWNDYFELEPFGELRADFRMATLAAVLVNALTRTKDSDPIKTAADFMPDFEKAFDEKYKIREEAAPEEEQKLHVWQKISRVLGAMVKKPRTSHLPPTKRNAQPLPPNDGK
jgi:hypothetical protein